MRSMERWQRNRVSKGMMYEGRGLGIDAAKTKSKLKRGHNEMMKRVEVSVMRA